MPGPSSDEEVTDLLRSWNKGDQTALEKLIPLIDHELRTVAHAYLRRKRSDVDLHTTALVNELFARLADKPQIEWQGRRHFFAIAAQVMRRLLVDDARKKIRDRADAEQITLTDLSSDKSKELLLLDEALNRLEEVDQRKAKIVELRYFGGLTMEETAQILGISSSTAQREWRFARAWLQREVGGGGVYVSITTQKPEKAIQKPEMPTSVTEDAERKLAEAWSNRELVETLMIGKWAGLKLLVQLRKSPNVTKEELASVLETDAVIVSFILLKLEEFGALKKQSNVLSLTNRGAKLLENFEMAIGKASTD